MSAITLFQLKGSTSGMFDGSVNGISILKSTNAKVLPGDAGISLDRGSVDIARHKDLDSLQSFTLEATITPTRVGGTRQNIVEGQSPSIAFFIEANGKLVGSVHTAAGWVTVDSGATLLKAGVAQRVTFTRAADGKTLNAIEGNRVGAGAAPGPIQNIGALGFRVGLGMDGQNFSFAGTVTDLSIRQGVVTQQFFVQRKQEGLRLENIVLQAGAIKKISVRLLPDESHAQLQHVKDIMNAAGVDTLSDLATLPVKQRTPLSRGQILLAPRKSSVATVNWADVAKAFRAGDVAVRRETLATHLTNQNSAAFLSRLPARPIATLPSSGLPATRVRSATPLTGATAVSAARIRVSELPRHTVDLVEVSNNRLTAVDSSLIPVLKANEPWKWPATSIPLAQVMEPKTIPINSAVVIAGTLDLTNMQFVVEPNVETLYIIAETVICGDNAAVTWRRPGGSTPGRADNPDLNGRDFPGIQTKPDSRDGIDGTNGLNGDTGTPGAMGRNAPNIEMWVKNMTGMPNLDFNGEDGIRGGAGQRGGRGGNGGSGSGGKRLWAFGWHCISDPGDGGDGGNGGRGGDGGRGGNGGNAGKITIGVLTGTLASTVVNKSFKIKNQGGHRGDGGPGGSGGAGGFGGRSGNGETCTSAKDGHNGSQGQPGAPGAPGFTDGSDAFVTFFEFTQQAWDDLMTRPWITAITPPEAFPGDRLTIRGSRFTTNDHVLIGASVLSPTVNPDESI